MSLITEDKHLDEIAREKKKFWSVHRERQEDSGLSGLAYCRKFKLNYRQFSYWGQKEEENEVPKFTPVHIETPSERDAKHSSIRQQQETLCTLVFKKGQELKIHDQALVPMLLSLLG
jgi:hypothetical protein